MNIVNYTIISRILELMLCARRKLDEFNDIIMFVAFTRSTKITIMNESITVSEILSCMLR